MLVLLGAIVVLFTTVPGALAQSDVDLGAGTSGVVQFIATGGGGNFDLNMCAKAVNGVCVGNQVQGPGSGDGLFLGNNGFYTLAGGGVTGTLASLPSCIVCQWTLSGNLGFNFGSAPGGSDLLDGTFTLLSMTQKANVNGVGFNQMVKVNFSATGGTLQKYFDPSGKGFITLNLKFTTVNTIQSINPGPGSSRFGLVVDGTVTPTPEPGTMALLGSGVLFVGGFLRKKFGA
jgi:PEP-CTERM motif